MFLGGVLNKKELYLKHGSMVTTKNMMLVVISKSGHNRQI